MSKATFAWQIIRMHTRICKRRSVDIVQYNTNAINCKLPFTTLQRSLLKLPVYQILVTDNSATIITNVIAIFITSTSVPNLSKF